MSEPLPSDPTEAAGNGPHPLAFTDRLRVEAVADGWLLAGEIDSQSAALLTEALSPNRARTPASPVVLDIRGVTFMDSSGLQAVIDLTRRIRAAGGELILRHPAKVVARLIEITGLSTFFRVEG